MTARALMILGTASHVGKSIITVALGRIFSDEGIRVAPFKAQNMSLNSAATPDGGEIGRAQALQAEACRIASSVEMNPVLIKPCSDSTSQVVLLGKVWGQVSAVDYHTQRADQLFPAVVESYRKLASQYELVLLEGAGSPAEINLREHDIVNLRMARAANAACLLVGDIDRGGVFASLVGTMELLEPGERDLIKGFVINRFRGDKTLLQPGVEMIERRLRLPCVGVVPYLTDLHLDEEDSVAMEERQRPQPPRAWKADEDDSPGRKLRVGVIAFPHLSNFTDFDALAAEPSVALAFLRDPADIALADVLILPGTKQTLDDFDWLSSQGFVPQILKHRGRNKLIMGICGGFQMLGLGMQDPEGMENNGLPATREGLKIIGVRTVFQRAKTTRLVAGHVCCEILTGHSLAMTTFKGYEIHLGETRREAGVSEFARIAGVGEESAAGAERYDGAVSENGRSFGTYVHGIFDEDRFRHGIIAAARASAGLGPAQQQAWLKSEREAQLERLANHLRGSLDMEQIRGWIGLGREQLSLTAGHRRS